MSNLYFFNSSETDMMMAELLAKRASSVFCSNNKRHINISFLLSPSFLLCSSPARIIAANRPISFHIRQNIWQASSVSLFNNCPAVVLKVLFDLSVGGRHIVKFCFFSSLSLAFLRQSETIVWRQKVLTSVTAKKCAKKCKRPDEVFPMMMVMIIMMILDFGLHHIHHCRPRLKTCGISLLF